MRFFVFYVFCIETSTEYVVSKQIDKYYDDVCASNLMFRTSFLQKCMP